MSDLGEAAAAAATRAYAPYSNYFVGAAGRVDDGRIVTACNVENASYGLVSALHATGGGRLVEVEVRSPDGRVLQPCGRCRQLLLEAGGPDLPVNGRPMRELLPDAWDELIEPEA